jgi:serine/threonine-protein kinase
VAGALGLALIVLGALFWRATPPIDRPLVRLDVDLGPDVSLGSLAGANAILSPDGTRLVYVSRNRLLTRRLDQQQATELPGSEGAYAPFFSPDSRWVAFFVAGKLKKVSATGGSAIVLCNAPIGLGGSWGEDGTIIAALNAVGGLFRIPAGGGAPARLTELDRERGEVTHRWPQILPGGKTVLFTAHSLVSGFDDASIEVIVIARPPQEDLDAGRQLRPIRPQRPSPICEQRNAVCRAVRADLSGGSWRANTHPESSRLQQYHRLRVVRSLANRHAGVRKRWRAWRIGHRAMDRERR